MDLPEWARVVGVDTETSGLYPDDGARVSTVVLSWRDPDGGLVKQALPFDQGRLAEKMPLIQLDLFASGEGDINLPESDWHDLMAWLVTRDLLIMHNGKFDLHMIEAGTRHWDGICLDRVQVWDTMVAAKELDPLLPVGLDAVSTRMGFEGKVSNILIKEWLKSRKLPEGRYDLVPWSIMEPYALGDADQTLKVFENQLDEAEERGLDAKIDREQRLMRVLQKLERRGIPYNVVRSYEIADQIDARIAELERMRPFGHTLKDARNWFFEKHGAPIVRTTTTGAASLDEPATRRLIADKIPWAEEYAELAVLKTSSSMWYRGYADKIGLDGRLRCSFRQTKVVSSRMSVERVNLQAIPKVNKKVEALCGDGTSVRSLVQPPEGRSIFNLDLQQAELRVAAKYAQCTTMLDMLAAGADLHAITTKAVLGVDEDHPEWKLKRDTGKRLTFSSIFQIGGATLQVNLEEKAEIYLPIEACNEMVRKWRAQYPEYGDAYRKAEALAQKRGYVRLLPNTEYETRSYFGPTDFPNTAWSRMVQGSLAEALKLWLIESEDAYPGCMILTVHDSIVVEGPTSQAEMLAQGIAQLGGNLLTELFGIEMLAEAGPWRG